MSYLSLIALLGTSLLGSVAGVLGSFAVLRRRALLGDLLSHAALPGLCLAFMILGTRHFLGMLGGALVSGLAAVALITLVCRWTRTKEDAALGIVLSTFFGGGIVLSSIIQKRPGGEPAGLESYIYGQVVGMSRQDLYLFAAVSAAALLVVVLLYKEFQVLSFDPGFARAQGWPTLGLDMTMMGTLALVTVAGLP
ncbi:MAG: metal ABC transporter permease, partial [Planctomycetota bacterium]